MPYNVCFVFATDVDGDEIQLPAYNLIIGFNRLRSFNLRQTLGYRNTSAKNPKNPDVRLMALCKHQLTHTHDKTYMYTILIQYAAHTTYGHGAIESSPGQNAPHKGRRHIILCILAIHTRGNIYKLKVIEYSVYDH